MVADDFRDFRIRETRILSDYGLLVVLAVKDKSCRIGILVNRHHQISDSSKDG